MEEVFCKNDLKSKGGYKHMPFLPQPQYGMNCPANAPVCARHLCIQMKIDISVTKILKKYEQRGKT